MNNIERLAERYRVPVKRDECGDRIIRGRNGHLYVDAGQIMVCFTDDGRQRPFASKQFKAARLKLLPGIRLTQEGDYEFVGEIPEALVWTALFRVLGVKRFRVDHGESRIFGGKRISKATLEAKNVSGEGWAGQTSSRGLATRFNPAKGSASHE